MAVRPLDDRDHYCAYTACEAIRTDVCGQVVAGTVKCR